jgi:UDP:flavonoid glycosyltransferase YjiC (YdhE family)
MRSGLRIFISAFGATGHVFPALALSRELRSRGHRVTFETLERWRETVEELGLDFVAAPEYVAFPGPWPGMPARPTLPEVVRGLATTLEELRPDLVLNDFFTLPAALAAELRGDRRATLIPHPYPGNEPGRPFFMVGHVPPRTRVGEGLWRLGRPWYARRPERERRELNQARVELGLEAQGRFYGGMSGDLVLVATFPQLEYPREWPAHVHVTGPMLFELPHPEIGLPDGGPPLVVVAGSTAQDQELELVGTSLEALASEPVRVLASMNQRGREWGEPVPANARVVDWVSYAEVLPGAAALVCNGGHGTIVRSLSEGVPLLVCPGPGDMAMNGAHVAWAGAGLMLPRALLRPGALRWALRSLIGEPRFNERARRIAAWSREHDGAAAGAELIERHSASR